MSSHARWLFGTAAAFNFSVATGLLFFRPWLPPPLRLDPIEGTNLVLVNLAGGLIGLFGYAYVRLAVNPVAYRPFIPLSVIGKLMAVASATWPWLTGNVPWTLPAATAVDLVYVVLFVDFLRRTRSTT